MNAAETLVALTAETAGAWTSDRSAQYVEFGVSLAMTLSVIGGALDTVSGALRDLGLKATDLTTQLAEAEREWEVSRQTIRVLEFRKQEIASQNPAVIATFDAEIHRHFLVLDKTNRTVARVRSEWTEAVSGCIGSVETSVEVLQPLRGWASHGLTVADLQRFLSRDGLLEMCGILKPASAPESLVSSGIGSAGSSQIPPGVPTTSVAFIDLGVSVTCVLVQSQEMLDGVEHLTEDQVTRGSRLRAILQGGLGSAYSTLGVMLAVAIVPTGGAALVVVAVVLGTAGAAWGNYAGSEGVEAIEDLDEILNDGRLFGGGEAR